VRKIIAILRGVKPNEVLPIAEQIVESGITTIEVPLNSPQPMDSIELLANRLGDCVTVGAGTVLSVADVQKVKDAGGKIVVSPNCNTTVIQACKAAKMLSFPGVFTATECFSALEAGADGLKLFPASLLGLGGWQALKAVLPNTVQSYAVSGVGPDDFEAWLKAGISGFGLGSAIYKPGLAAEAVRYNADRIVEAYDHASLLVSS